MSNAEVRPPLPPFTRESAIEKVRLAEDGWNSRDPERVSLAYTLDTRDRPPSHNAIAITHVYTSNRGRPPEWI